MRPLSNLATRDIETVIHPYTNLAAHRETGPLVLERGHGIRVWDSEGKEYIEGLAGLWCTSLGYGNEELIEAITKQLRTLSYSHLFGGKSHDTAIELAEKLKEWVPCEASKMLFCSSGSEANDTQIKLLWYYNNAMGRPKKKKIISRVKGYHGVTVASASLTGLPPVHKDFDLPIANILHTDCPHHYRFAEDGESEAEFVSRLARNLEALIEREGAETIAAFIAEPIMGAGGVIVPPEGYFEAVQPILRAHDIKIIGDEVICGFARTGNMFGSQTFGLVPDTVSMAKAITSAYYPLGALSIAEDVYQAMLEQSRRIGTFGHGYTYTAHPVAAAAALKTLEIYERDNILSHVRSVIPTFEERFRALADHPLVGEVRVKGLIGAVELVADKKTKRAFDPKDGVGVKAMNKVQERGVISRAVAGDSLALCPPLIITKAEVDELFDRFGKGLDDMEALVSRDNLRAA